MGGAYITRGGPTRERAMDRMELELHRAQKEGLWLENQLEIVEVTRDPETMKRYQEVVCYLRERYTTPHKRFGCEAKDPEILVVIHAHVHS